ncbi:MAG: GGDEF domain-containing protein [Pseudonocardiaceae bacterium]
MPEELRRELDRLRGEHAEAREQSLRDSLTASYNRRYLDQRLDHLVAAERTGIAVAIVDLDFFKQVNDTHGHHIGDQVLQRVVQILQEDLPDSAFCARYGGEEFVLVMPDIRAGAAVGVCEAARARVEHHSWSQVASGLTVTVSVGVAHRDLTRSQFRAEPERRMSGVSTLLRSADHLLYQVKQSGRNAVAYRSGDWVVLAGMARHRRGQPGAAHSASGSAKGLLPPAG